MRVAGAAALVALIAAGMLAVVVRGATIPGVTATCDLPPGTVRVVGLQYGNVDANALRIFVSLPVEGDEVFPSATTFFSLPSDFQTAHGFTQFVVPSTRPTGTYIVTATTFHNPGGLSLETARTTLPLPCPAAQATPTPTPTPTPTAPPADSQLACGPAASTPGSMISAIGTGFPKSTAVLLTWKTGINVTPQLTTLSDATGGFQVPVLIFPHDQVGPRVLAATPDPKLSDPPFKEVDAQCLVGLGPVQPRDFAWRR